MNDPGRTNRWLVRRAIVAMRREPVRNMRPRVAEAKLRPLHDSIGLGCGTCAACLEASRVALELARLEEVQDELATRGRIRWSHDSER